MLSPNPPGQKPTHGAGFWCEAAAYTPYGTGHWLGSKPATTPRLALRWLRSRAQDIADQLDTPAARPLRHWLSDHPEHERALTYLLQGHAYTLTAHEDSTRYTLTARPTAQARAWRHPA